MKGDVVASKREKRPIKAKDVDPVIDQRLAAAIGHPLRVAILVECDRAPISPKEFSRQKGIPLSDVAYHFRKLEKLDCVQIVDEIPRRGAHEHIYAVTKRALITDDDFREMPAVLRGGFNASVLNTFSDRAREAIEAETFDSYENHHATWTPLRLDKQGFDNLMERLMDVFKQGPVEQLAAESRMSKSGEQPIYVTLGLFGFESPKPDRDHSLDS